MNYIYYYLKKYAKLLINFFLVINCYFLINLLQKLPVSKLIFHNLKYQIANFFNQSHLKFYSKLTIGQLMLNPYRVFYEFGLVKLIVKLVPFFKQINELIKECPQYKYINYLINIVRTICSVNKKIKLIYQTYTCNYMKVIYLLSIITLISYLNNKLNTNGLINSKYSIILLNYIEKLFNFIKNCLIKFYYHYIKLTYISIFNWLFFCVIFIIIILIIEISEYKLKIYFPKLKLNSKLSSNISICLPLKLNMVGLPSSFIIKQLLFILNYQQLLSNNYFYYIIYSFNLIIGSYLYLLSYLYTNHIDLFLQQKLGLLHGIRPGNDTLTIIKSKLFNLNIIYFYLFYLITILVKILKINGFKNLIIYLLFLVNISLSILRKIKTILIVNKYDIIINNLFIK